MRLFRFALLVGIVSGILAVLIVGASYYFAVNSAEKGLHRYYLGKAKMLVLAAANEDDLPDAELLSRIQQIWSSAEEHPEDEYICITDSEAVLLLHSTHPQTVGNCVADNVLLGTGQGNYKTVQELISSESDYVGHYISSAGQNQIAAFARLPGRDWTIGVHRSKAALDSQVRGHAIPLIAGVACITLLLFPISLALHYRAFEGTLNSAKKARLSEMASEKRYHHLFDSMGEGFVAVDVKDFGRISMANPAADILYGVGEGELVGRYLQEFTDPAESQQAEDQLEIRRGGQVSTYEMTIIREDSSRRIIQVTASPRLDNEGAFAGSFSLLVDITERKVVEEALVESEGRYRMLIENQGDLIVKASMEGTLQFVSPSYCLLFGKAEEELLGTAFMPLVHEHDREQTAKEMERLTSPPHAVNVEQRAMTIEGWRWLGWMYTTVLDQDGLVESIIGVGRDVTERKQTEEALRENEQKYRLLAENVTDLIWTTDLTGRYTYVSPSILEFSGRTVEEGMALGAFEKLSLESTRMFRDCLANELKLEADPTADLQRSATLVHETIHKDDSTFWAETTVSFLRDDEGVAIGFVGASRKITERKLAEDALAASEERYKLLSSMTSDYAGSVVVDSDGVLTAEWIAGSHKEITGRDFDLDKPVAYDATHPDDREETQRSIAQTLDNKLTVSETRLIKPDGSIVWLRTTRQPKWDDKQKRVASFISVVQDITERKSAEESLRESEERYKLLSRMTSDYAVSVTVDCEGNMTNEWVTGSFKEITGFGYEAGSPVMFSCIHQDDLDEFQHNITNTLKNEPTVTEYRMLKPDGSLVWLRVSRQPEWDGRQQRVVRFVSVAQDITERKLAEDALQASETQHRMLVESMDEGIVMTTIGEDDEPRYSFANQAAEQIFGVGSGELVGRLVDEFTAQEYLEESLQHITNRRSGKSETYDGDIVRPDGERRSLLVNAKPRYENGEYCGSFSIFSDITERKKAEAALLESEIKYRGLFDESVAAVFAFDNDKNFIAANQAGVDLLGFSKKELLQMCIPDVDVDAIEVKPAQKEVFSGNRLVNFEHKLKRKDGRVITVLNNSRSLTDAEGNITGVQSTLLDITERKEAESALRESEEFNHAIIEQSPLGISVRNRHGKLLKNNKAWQDIWGMQDEEITVMLKQEEQVLAFDEGDDYLGGMQEEVRRIYRSGGSLHIPEMRTRGGRPGCAEWVSQHFSAVTNEDGEVEQVIILTEDISERKQAEAALLESHQHLVSAQRIGKVGFMSYNPRTNEMQWSDEVYRIFHVNKDELPKPTIRSFQELLHVEDRQVVADKMNRALKTGEPFKIDVRIVCPDGVQIWVTSHIEVSLDSEGKPELLQGMIADITGRKQAAEDLRLSQESLMEAQKIASIGSWTWDLLSNKIDGSHQLYSMLGVKAGTIPTLETIFQGIAAEDQEVFTEVFEGVSRGVFKERFEFRYNKPDGSTIFVVARTKVHSDDLGAITKLVGTLQDITDYKQQEEALKQSEIRFRSMFELHSAVMLLIDPTTGDIVDGNAAAIEFYGYSIEQLKSMNTNQISQLPPEEVREHLQKSQAIEQDCFHFPHKTASGETKWVEVHSTPINIQGTKQLFSIIHDVTERKQAEEQLKRLSTAIQHAGETVVITDKEGSIQYVNPSFCRISGYTEEEAIGQNPRVLNSGYHDEAFFKNLWDTISMGKSWHGRLVNKTKDGTLFHEDATISPIFDGNDQIINYVAVKRDVTQEVSLESQLRQTQKMEAIGTLAGGIAHDFNNILFAILGYAELAAYDIPEHNSANESLEQIVIAGKRATELVKQILTFSRRAEKKKIAINVSSIAKETVRMLRASLPTTIGVSLRLNTAESTINADPTEIHQVIMNLCTNAGHAMMDQGGELEIGLSTVNVDETAKKQFSDLTEGQHLVLSVSDTGPGIPPDVLNKIFEPFFTTKEVGEGTGMGLAVVHGIILDLGGAINVVSEVGKGTCFKLYIPLVVTSPILGVAEPGLVPRGTERILMVDDEPTIAHMVAEILQSLGYTVAVFTDSQEALDEYLKEPGDFDLVITDQTMGKLTGGELAKRILAEHPQQPIILVTGFSQTLPREKAEAIGITSYISKPVSKNSLAKVVRDALDG